MKILRFSAISRLLMLFGGIGGLLAALIYIGVNHSTISPGDALLILVSAPVLQALTLLLYGAVGFPGYKYLAKRRLLGLHRLPEDESWVES